jgi:hypothetical protein
MRVILCTTALLCLLLLDEAHSQTDSATASAHGLELGEYTVGFRLLEAEDHSRAVTGGSSARTHPRPLRTYLWYPAAGTDDAQPLHFARYATLADEDIWPVKIAGALREELKYAGRPLARSLGPVAFEALLQQSVLAIENAAALPGPFPLIVIGQGLYYESPVAFAEFSEYLAGHGFVVATSPLVGTDSPFVRVDVQDLETQVRDLEFVIAQARRLPHVSAERLGVFGFDMGGMAGLILTMRNPDVDAFMSADSGILFKHPSGIPAASPDYDPLALRVPWLHGTGVYGAMQAPGVQEESLFDKAIHSSRYLLVVDGMGHVDFTSYGLIPGRNEVPRYWQAAEPSGAAGQASLSQYALHFFAATLRQDQESQALLSQDPPSSSARLSMTLEHRSASPAAIGYQQFVHGVITGDGDRVIDEVRALREAQPNHMLLNEESLSRLILSLRDTWGLIEEARQVIIFMAELYPTSPGALWMLAESHIDTGYYPAAIEVYNRLLEQDPNDSGNFIKPRLEWLYDQ